MADGDKFTLENVRLFMIEMDGVCTNHDVVARFKRFLNDPVKKLENRNKLKEFVQLLATVESQNGEKVLVLKKRYQELGCFNLLSNQEHSEQSSVIAEPSPLAIPEHFDENNPAPQRPNRSNKSKNQSSQPPEFGFYSSKNNFSDEPKSSSENNGFNHLANNQYETRPNLPIQDTPKNYEQQPPWARGGHISDNSKPQNQGDNNSSLPENNSMGFYSQLAATRGSFSGPTGPPPPSQSTAHSYETNKLTDYDTSEVNLNMPSIENRDVVLDDNSSSTPETSSDGKKTPLSAKDRIKHFNEKISTEQANEVYRPQPMRRANRESRLSNAPSLHQHHQHLIEPDDVENAMPMVSRDNLDIGPKKVDSRFRVDIDVLEPKEKEWMVASSACDYNKMYKLLLDQPDLAHRRDFINGNAMHWAAKLGKPDVIKLLNGYKVDVNLRSHCGYTPLHLAAMAGAEECIDLLVNLCKAMPNVRDFYGKRPKQYLKRNCSTRIQQMLLNNSRQVFSVGLTADESSSFARTQSFSAKIMKTTQGLAKRLSSVAKTDNGKDHQYQISAIIETPDTSPGEIRKSRSRDSSVTHSIGSSGASSEYDSAPLSSSDYGYQFRASSHTRNAQLMNDKGIPRSESSPNIERSPSTFHNKSYSNLRDF